MTDRDIEVAVVRRIHSHLIQERGKLSHSASYVFGVETNTGTHPASMGASQLSAKDFSDVNARIRVSGGGQVSVHEDGFIAVHMAATTAKHTSAEAIGIAVKTLIAASREGTRRE